MLLLGKGVANVRHSTQFIIIASNRRKLGLPDGGKISVYRVVDVIRIDIKRPETKRV